MKQTNSFNPYKCLLYKDYFDGIIKNRLRPPIEVNIDPITTCNQKCVWCNAWRVLDHSSIPIEDMELLLRELEVWGVKAICFAGGGEPSLYLQLAQVLDRCTAMGLETSMISNGSRWSNLLIEAMAKNMRWIGISVDAGTRDTFKSTKQVDHFDQVIGNITALVQKRKELNSKIGITFKYLIHTMNQHEILTACKLAKRIGCDSFHVRPVDFLAFLKQEEQLDIEGINKQVRECEKLKNDHFDVIPYFINFDKELHRKIEFDKCRLSPLLGICLPSGWWICIDQKGKEGLKLCEVNEIRKFWGSQKHLEILNSINPKDCGKCTLAKYYPWFEAYEKDSFYWKFV